MTDYALRTGIIVMIPPNYSYTHYQSDFPAGHEPTWLTQGHDIVGTNVDTLKQPSEIQPSPAILFSVLEKEQIALSEWSPPWNTIATFFFGIPSGSIYGIFILTFYLTVFLAYTLAAHLGLDLASILANFLAYILISYPAFFLAYVSGIFSDIFSSSTAQGGAGSFTIGNL